MNYKIREKIIWLIDLIAGVLTLAYILLHIGWEAGGKWRLIVIILVAIVVAAVAYFIWPEWPYYLIQKIPWRKLGVIWKWFAH